MKYWFMIFIFGIFNSCGIFDTEQHHKGCTDQYACNYDQSAQENDNSCIFPEGTCDCDGNPINGACDCNGTVDLGCGCGLGAPSGCDNTCGSTLQYDECGICGGDNLTCENSLSFNTPSAEADKIHVV